jgi:monoamine oxidase
MTTKQTDILIIGAGLTGLTLAYYLKDLNINVTVVESRARLGGRIYTKYATNEAPIELGATWLVDEHTELLKLLNSLELRIFEQYYGPTAIYEPSKDHPPQLVRLPPNNSKSYRIHNGTQSIIEALANTLDDSQIITDCTIHTIKQQSGHISALSNDIEFKCQHVISTLPPFLFQKTIRTEPALPSEILDIMQNTHTWMHDSIKVGFTYKTAFWQGEKTSGTIYSNANPLQEFYDHSSADGHLHALVGFMNSSFFDHSKAERQQLALKQLQRYYGDQVQDFLSYEDVSWKDQRFTTAIYDRFIMPQQNNGHPSYQNSYFNNGLFIAGTETSPYASGKMEGAIRSAQHIFTQLKTLL